MAVFIQGVEQKVVAATLVVAASNSLHPERADYICDGVADQVEIQAALDALPASGGKVVLLEGNYNIPDAASINPVAKSSLVGQGIDKTILNFAIDSGGDISGIYPQGDYVSIEDLTLKYADVTVPRHCIRCDTGQSYLYVRRVKFEAWGGMDVLLIGNCKQVTIDSCQRVGGYHANICMVGCQMSGGLGPTKLTIQNCYCENRPILWIEGASYGYCLDFKILDNTIINGEGNPIGCYRAHRSVIRGNIIINTTQAMAAGGPIDIEAATNCEVVGNSIYVSGVAGGSGIFSGHGGSKNTISGNTIIGAANGIILFGSSYNTLVGNICMNNTFAGIRLKPDGIVNCLYNVINGNNCSDDQGTHTQDYGIYSEVDGATTPDYQVVVGNICKGNTVAAISLVGTHNENVHNILV